MTRDGGQSGHPPVEGSATLGALDPDRVKRGMVNTGEIVGDVTPDGDRLSFAISGDQTLPVDRGEASDRKVWMQRVGPWLVVSDNYNCGGVNVSFRWASVRKP